MDSNTTLVKVKFTITNIVLMQKNDSNTTLVKVKFEGGLNDLQDRIFKYNTC